MFNMKNILIFLIIQQHIKIVENKKSHNKFAFMFKKEYSLKRIGGYEIRTIRPCGVMNEIQKKNIC